MDSSYLHSNIMYEILLRTSSDDLARSRVASEEWNQTTYDSKFKKLHSQKADIVDGFFIHDQFTRNYIYSFASSNDKTHKISLDFVPEYDVRIEIVSKNSGIILCTSRNFRQYRVPFFFVCKPRNKLFQQILNPRTRFLPKGMAISVIHSNSFRYKILRISSPKLKFVKGCENLILKIFDSEAWKWKRLNDISLSCGVQFWSDNSVVTPCGAFHWLLHPNLTFLFDIKEEEWKTIGLPVIEDDYRFVNMVKYEGKLALTYMDMEDYMHMWVLESYRNLVWQKRFVVNMKEPGSRNLTYIPMVFYGSDIIVVREPWSLKYYDFKNKQVIKEIKLNMHNNSCIFPFWSDSKSCCLKPVREFDFQCSSRKRKNRRREIG